MHAGGKMRRAEPPVELVLFNPGIGLFERVEFPGERFEHFAHTLLRYRAVILAGLGPVTIDAVTLDLGFVVIDRGARQRHETMRSFQFLHRRADVVR